jgi:hypothetical protein
MMMKRHVIVIVTPCKEVEAVKVNLLLLYNNIGNVIISVMVILII